MTEHNAQTYANKFCRCSVCKLAWSIKNKNYRDSHKAKGLCTHCTKPVYISKNKTHVLCAHHRLKNKENTKRYDLRKKTNAINARSKD